MTGSAIAVAMTLIAESVILGSPPVTMTDTSNTPSDTLQAQTDLADRMTIEVAVQGGGPYRFLIDTGSQRTVVSTALAETLKLPSGPMVRVVSIAGRTSEEHTSELQSLMRISYAVFRLQKK